MYNNKFKYDEKFTAEDKKVFFFLGGGGGLSPFHPFENSSLRYSFIFPFKIILSFNLPPPPSPLEVKQILCAVCKNILWNHTEVTW